MAIPPSTRFQRYGKTPTIDDLIKDCRDLQSQVDSLAKLVDELQKKVAANG